MGRLNVRKAGERDRGTMIGITGQPGAGKTTLAATMPRPLLLDAEGGGWVLAEQGTDVHDDWELRAQCRGKEFLALLRELKDSDYATIIIDSWTRVSEWLEQDILDEDGRAESLMSALGGYGKGRDAHVSRTAQVIETLQWLQNRRRMNVVWILHTKLGQVDLPSGESYSYFGNEGVKDSTKRVLMACDEVAMLRQRVDVVKGKGETTGKARGKGERELFVGPYPYMDTKSRFIREPQTIAVEWGVNPFGHALKD